MTSTGPSGTRLLVGVRRQFDHVGGHPAEIVTELGETLRQTPLGVALAGDLSRHSGSSRSIGYRWFTDSSARDLYPPEDHEFSSRMYVSGLRGVLTRRGPQSQAARLVQLLDSLPEFHDLWLRHEVGIRPKEIKRYQAPRGRAPGAELPSAAGFGAITLAPRLHRYAG